MSLTSISMWLLPSAHLNLDLGSCDLALRSRGCIYFVCMVIQTRFGRMVCTTPSFVGHAQLRIRNARMLSHALAARGKTHHAATVAVQGVELTETRAHTGRKEERRTAA